MSFGDQPDIFPVNYVVDHGTIVFRTAEGTKFAAAVLGRGVAFEIDGYEAEAGDTWSVVVKGRADEIERVQEVFDALDLPLFPSARLPQASLRAHRAAGHQWPSLWSCRPPHLTQILERCSGHS